MLPPGWAQAQDQRSGNEYYFNHETGETSWTKPSSPISVTPGQFGATNPIFTKSSTDHGKLGSTPQPQSAVDLLPGRRLDACDRRFPTHSMATEKESAQPHQFHAGRSPRKRRRIIALTLAVLAIGAAAYVSHDLLGGGAGSSGDGNLVAPTPAPAPITVALSTKVALPPEQRDVDVGTLTGAIVGALGGMRHDSVGALTDSAEITPGSVAARVVQTISHRIEFDPTQLDAPALRTAAVALACPNVPNPSLSPNATEPLVPYPHRCVTDSGVVTDGIDPRSSPAVMTIVTTKTLGASANAGELDASLRADAYLSALGALVGAPAGATLVSASATLSAVQVFVEQVLVVAGGSGASDGQRAAAAGATGSDDVLATVAAEVGGDAADLTHETTCAVRVAGDAAASCPAGQFRGTSTVRTERGESTISACERCPASTAGDGGTCASDCHAQAQFERSLSQPPGFPRVQRRTVAPLPLQLPSSVLGRLVTLSRVDAGCARVQQLARSYDGHAWEGVMPEPLAPEILAGCQGVGGKQASCALAASALPQLVVGAAYRIDAVDVTAQTANESAARLLTQASFGPSHGALRQFEAAHGMAAGPEAAVAWVQRQQALPPTLLRSYMRARAHPRQQQDSAAGRSRAACEAGSRWHTFAFTLEDRFSELTVAQEKAGLWSLRVHGQLRTEVAHWRGAAAPSPANASLAVPTRYRICHVHEQAEHSAESSQGLQLSSDECDKSNKKKFWAPK